MNGGTDRFMDWLYDESRKITTLLDCQQTDLHTLKEKKRSDFERVLGLTKLKTLLENTGFSPQVDTLSTEERDGYTFTTAEVTTLPYLHSGLYVLEPAETRGVVIYCHGHGNGVRETVDTACAEDYQKRLPVHLAKKGYKVYANELTGFGHMLMHGFKQEEQRGCYANATQLLMHRLTMAAVRVNQTMQLIDHVNQTHGVKPFLAGISGGGLVASFTAALCDDIKGAFVSCYANTFKGSIMAMHHCVDNFIPGILSVGEEPELIALACPKPMLISAGKDDPIFPLTHTLAAADEIKAIYKRFGAEDKVDVEIFDGEHQISENTIYTWLEKYR